MPDMKRGVVDDRPWVLLGGDGELFNEFFGLFAEPIDAYEEAKLIVAELIDESVAFRLDKDPESPDSYVLMVRDREGDIQPMFAILRVPVGFRFEGYSYEDWQPMVTREDAN